MRKRRRAESGQATLIATSVRGMGRGQAKRGTAARKIGSRSSGGAIVVRPAQGTETWLSETGERYHADRDLKPRELALNVYVESQLAGTAFGKEFSSLEAAQEGLFHPETLVSLGSAKTDGPIFVLVSMIVLPAYRRSGAFALLLRAVQSLEQPVYAWNVENERVQRLVARLFSAA